MGISSSNNKKNENSSNMLRKSGIGGHQTKTFIEPEKTETKKEETTSKTEVVATRTKKKTNET